MNTVTAIAAPKARGHHVGCLGARPLGRWLDLSEVNLNSPDYDQIIAHNVRIFSEPDFEQGAYVSQKKYWFEWINFIAVLKNGIVVGYGNTTHDWLRNKKKPYNQLEVMFCTLERENITSGDTEPNKAFHFSPLNALPEVLLDSLKQYDEIRRRK